MLTLRFAPETRQWLDDVATGGPWGGGGGRCLNGLLLGGKFAGSAWRQRHGAILDVGPHVFDLLDAALGPVVEVRAAAASEPDLWHVILGHRNGAISSATLSMRLAIDPSVLEFDVYGGTGRLALTPFQTPPPPCFATLLDELATMITSGATSHPGRPPRGAPPA